MKSNKVFKFFVKALKKIKTEPNINEKDIIIYKAMLIGAVKFAEKINKLSKNEAAFLLVKIKNYNKRARR